VVELCVVLNLTSFQIASRATGLFASYLDAAVTTFGGNAVGGDGRFLSAE